MRLQIRHGGIEAAEEKPAIISQARNPRQTMILTLKRLGVCAVVVIFHAYERAAAVKGPAMVRTRQNFLVAAFCETDRGPTMRAGVNKAADLSCLIAHEYDR